MLVQPIGYSPRHIRENRMAVVDVISVLVLSTLNLHIVLRGIHAAPTRIPRWLQPCAGEIPVEVGDEVDHVIRQADIEMPTSEDLYRLLSEHAGESKHRVLGLLERYALERFQDPGAILEELRTFSSLATMPAQTEMTAYDLTITQDPQSVVFSTYLHLSITLVHLEQARQDEILQEVAQHSYGSDFEHLQEDIYSKLCALQNVLHIHNVQLPSHMVERIGGIEITDVTTRALRHTRDCLVLRDLSNILHHVERAFILLSEPSES